MRRRTGAITLLLLGSLIAVVPAAPAAAADTGFFTGTIRDADTNALLPGACVTVFSRTAVEITNVCADGSGVYTTAQLSLAPQISPYRLRFTAPGHAEQWWNGKTGFTAATQVAATVTGKTADANLTTHFGTISGTIRVPGGGTEPLHQVQISRTDGSLVTTAYTRADGTYSVPSLPSGDYKIRLLALGGALKIQWLPQADTPDTATVFTVADGQVVTADGQFAERLTPTPLSQVTGRVFDGLSGAVAAGVTLHIIYPTYNFEYATVQTDAAGRYSATVSSGLRYQVQVTGGGYPTQWVPAAQTSINAITYGDLVDFPRPDDFAVVKGWTSAHGKITDPSGAPLADAQVSLLGRVRYRGSSTATTGADGTYEVPGLPESSYTMLVTHPSFGVQWYHQKPWEDQASADQLTLLANTPSKVDEQFAGRGSIEVTVLDKGTGAPLTNACVRIDQPGLSNPNLCTGPGGIYTVANLAPGDANLTVSAANHLTAYRSSSSIDGAYNLTIRPGQTTKVKVKLTPSGSLTLPVRAKPDGTFPRVCVYVVGTQFAADYADYPSESGACNAYGSDTPQGQFTITTVPAGPQQVFVYSASDGFGAQWLGFTGGTGDRRQAAIVTVPAGGTVQGPQIRLDRAGSIEGVTRAKGSGAPVPAVIRPFGGAAGLVTYCSSTDVVTGCSGSDGSFHIDGLGPYAWPISFTADNYAVVWSGGATNRYDATPVKVNSGQTTRVDAALPAGIRIVLNRGSNPVPYFAVTAYDDRTGDPSGGAWYGSDPSLVLNPGDYRVVYDDYSSAGGKDCWYVWSNAVVGSPSALSGLFRVSTARTLRLVPGDTCRPLSDNPMLGR